MERRVLTVIADEATQSERKDQLSVRGHLSIRADDWKIEAQSAVLFGKPDDPQKIEVTGEPASIIYRRPGADESLSAHSHFLIFEPGKDRLDLDGKAYVERARQAIASESILYFLDDDTFKTGSKGRVRVVTQPEPD